MSGVRFLARCELRRSWRAIVLLGLLAGLTGGDPLVSPLTLAGLAAAALALACAASVLPAWRIASGPASRSLREE